MPKRNSELKFLANIAPNKEIDINNLSREEIKLLLAYKIGVVHSLTEQLEKEKKTINELQKLLEIPILSKEGESIAPVNTFAFNRKWTWSEKIMFVVKSGDSPVTISEIIKSLQKHDSTYSRYPNLYSLLAPYLTKLGKNERLIPYKVKGNRAIYYIHPSWRDEDGNLKETYKAKIPLL